MKKNDSEISLTKGIKARAMTKYIRMSPRKMRLVLNAIRYKPVSEAFSILANLNKKASRLVEKTLRSAVANAKQKQMDESRLSVKIAYADGGPSFKRYLPRSMGRADTILKRSSHITVAVQETLTKRAEVKKDKRDKTTRVESVEKTKENKKREAAQTA